MQRGRFAPVFLGLLILAGLSMARGYYAPVAHEPQSLVAQAAAPAEPAPPTTDTTSQTPSGTVEKQCTAGSVDVVAESTGDSQHPTVTTTSCFQTVALLPPVPGQNTPASPDTSPAPTQQTQITSTVCQKAQQNKCVVETCPPQALDPDTSQSSGATCTSVASCAPGDTACLNQSIQQASGPAAPSISDVSFLQPTVPTTIQSTGPSNVITAPLNNPTSDTGTPTPAPSTTQAPAPPANILSAVTAQSLDLNTETVQQVTSISAVPDDTAPTSAAPAPASPADVGNSTFSSQSPQDTAIKDTVINFMTNGTLGFLKVAVSAESSELPASSPFTEANQPGGNPTAFSMIPSLAR